MEMAASLFPGSITMMSLKDALSGCCRSSIFAFIDSLIVSKTEPFKAYQTISSFLNSEILRSKLRPKISAMYLNLSLVTPPKLRFKA